MTATYREMPELLKALAPFRGSSVRAEWTGVSGWPSYGHRSDVPEGVEAVYSVVSYSTRIAVYDPATDRSTVPDVSYSVTTSKIQYLCRRNLPRVESTAPESIDGIGPGVDVIHTQTDRRGHVRELYPISKQAVCVWNGDYGTHDPETDKYIPAVGHPVPVKNLELI